MSDKLSRVQKLDQLENYKKDVKPIEHLEAQVNLVESIKVLANINHETEYKTCYEVAEHLLEKVPQPITSDD